MQSVLRFLLAVIFRLLKQKIKFKDFVFLGWLKGKASALLCLGYGVMHATLEGDSYEISMS
jgi:hypothetical protein